MIFNGAISGKKWVLRNCPFCGAKQEDEEILVSQDDAGMYTVYCLTCQASGPERISEEEAMKGWNKRKR
jgi:Lar family restriction alleviation protein